MRKISEYIFLLLVGLLSSVTMNACRDNDNENSVSWEHGKYFVMVELSPLSVGNVSFPEETVSEMVKTARFIMVSNGKVEVNDFRTSLNQPASDVKVVFTTTTNAGEKDFYFIANEESVGNMNYGDMGNYTVTNFSNILNGYQKGADASGLIDLLSTAYFSPAYSPMNNQVYLPYTSCYKGIEVVESNNDADNNFQMYMVPVATKFLFRFVNNRQRNVEVNNICISSLNKQNYLLAQVGVNDYNKTLPDVSQPLYWVDWLAEVAKKSQTQWEYEENQDFNSLYGWIADYNTPLGDNPSPVTLLGVMQEYITIPAMNGETPGEQIIGPYYLPESFNLNGGTPLSQRYGLTLGLHDSSALNSTEDPEFDDVEIKNLKALFRDTYVIITINMNEGAVEIYAEIADWSHSSSNGFLAAGD